MCVRGGHSFFLKKPVIPARVRERDTFCSRTETQLHSLVRMENFRFLSVLFSCSEQQQKFSFIVFFFIVRLVRPSPSANGADLMKVGARNSGSGTTRLTGWESSWRRCSSTRIRPGTFKENKAFD